MRFTDMTGKQDVPRLSFRAAALMVTVAALGMAAITTGAVIIFSPERGPWTLNPANPQVTLEDVEREVIRRFPVADVTVSKLETLRTSGPVTLFDVRTEEEYEAGHLPGAIRIEPGSSAEDILRQHRDRLGDQPAVFYCAVGVRSSEMLTQTLRDLAPHTKGQLYNLRGGVFRWAAEGRTLVRGSEPGRPHPYDENWGQLLSRTLPGS